MDQFQRLAQSSRSEPYPEDSSPKRFSDSTTSIPGGTFVAEPLNDKEEKILQLIAEGMSNRQIAQTMFLAEGTVKNYVSRIMEKLHANTRTELAIRSRKQRQPE